MQKFKKNDKYTTNTTNTKGAVRKTKKYAIVMSNWKC